jgi:DNA-binding transcriptional MerR regulator
MSEPHMLMTFHRLESGLLTLDSLAACTGIHPSRIQYFVEYGLLEPSAHQGAQWLFDPASITRLRTIERLRRDLGANLAGIAVILDLLDRLAVLQREMEQWHRRS